MQDTTPHSHPLPTDAANPLLSAALEYAARGWHVYPLTPRSKAPLAGTHGIHSATTDPAIIRAWWAQEPAAGIGCALGPSGLCVLDLDRHPGQEGQSEAWLTENVAAGRSPLRDGSALAETSNGGCHFYYRTPDPAPLAHGAIAPSVELHWGHGHSIILPPSVHPSGHVYAWRRKPTNHLPRLPEWLASARPAIRTTDTRPQTAAGPQWLTADCPQGQRNSTAAQVAGYYASRGLTGLPLTTAVTDWSTAHCRPPLDAAEVAAVCRSIERLHPDEPSGVAPLAAPVAAADVRPSPLRWLWPKMLPASGFTLVFGRGGVGKTWVLCDLVATLSRGRPFPDGTPCRQGRTLYAAYDRPGERDRIVERLRSCGADCRQVDLAVYDLHHDRDAHLASLRAHIAAARPALVVVDSLWALMGPGDSLNPDPLLAAVSDLGVPAGAAVVGVFHPRKAAAGSANESVAGGQRMTSFPAQVLVVGADPDNADARAIAVSKANENKAPDPFGFRIASEADGDARIEWTGPRPDLDADMLVAHATGKRERQERERAESLIRSFLSDGEKPSRDLNDMLEAHGISERTAKRARATMGLVVRQVGQQGRPGSGGWLVRLPTAGSEGHSATIT